MPKVLTVIGARPQFIKAAMLSKALSQAGIQEVSVHTGQHYDENMSEIFFREMRIPKPHYNLAVGSDTHGRQTGAMLTRLDEIYEKELPDATIVYGDTNSTLAGALCSVKQGIPVIHIEAGMRSNNIYQPEESNRVLTDHASELLICSSNESAENLRREGIRKQIVIAGDIMLDSTLAFANMPSDILTQLQLKQKEYVLLTCHRPESTDVREHLANIVHAVVRSPVHIVFPVHPRTRKYLEESLLLKELEGTPHVQLIEPVGYIDMLHLQKHAQKIITDSGGMQKEAYFLGVPCITIREYTEWTELVTSGWNKVVGYSETAILEAITSFTPPPERPALFGSGHAAKTMCDAIVAFLKS
jgi:UDP-GlcNAc3NAcA epimerase